MRTNFPPTEAAPSARASLRRALLLSILLVIVWTALAFLPDPAQPADRPGSTQEQTAQIEQPAATPAAEPFQLVRPGYVMVVLFLALAGLGAIWLRKRQAPPVAATGMKTIGKLSLGPQQQVQLVRVAGEVLLLGTAPNGVSLIKAYPADQFSEVAAGAEHAEPGMWAKLLAALPPPRSTPESAGSASPDPEPDEPSETADHDLPEWSIATASAISDGPDFMHVLRRYSGRKTYKANTLYPPTGASN